MLRLTHALVASDLNPQYLDFWPLVRRAWEEVIGVEPVLVLVADEDEVPPDFRSDPAVRLFAPVPGLHTAFQAQCIRLLYPALLDTGGGAVITTDADMAPLDPRYFHRPLSGVSGHHFVAYRDVLVANQEIPICYNAARPATWERIFKVTSLGDIAMRLGEWWRTVVYSGTRGGIGWGTDQSILYHALVEHGRRAETVWILDDRFTVFHRLDHPVLRGRRGLDVNLSDVDLDLLRHGAYSDFHCVPPYRERRELNEIPVELAIQAVQRRRSRARGRWYRSGMPLDREKAR